MLSGLLKTYITIALIVLVLLGIAFFYAYREESLQFLSGENENKIEIKAPQPPPPPPAPSFKIEITKTKGVIRITWANLPRGTTLLDIFRAKLKTTNWVLWKTISISENELDGGEVELTLVSGESAFSYTYYVQSSPGTDLPPLWTSSSTEAQTPQVSSSTQSQAPSSTVTAPPIAPPPPPPPPLAPPPPLQQGATSTQGATSSEIYYNPQGQISSTSSQTQTGSFWVIHVNKNIELGWQNLPSNTDEIVIYRSISETGQWSELFRQGSPDIVGPTHIRLVDNTINNPYYYKMDAKNNGTTIQSYGPFLLEALQE